MQLITHKLIPPSTFPTVPASKAGKYAYRLGLSFCPSMDLVATYPILTKIRSHQSHANDDLRSDTVDEAANGEIGSTETYGISRDDEERLEVDIWRFNGQRVFGILVEDDDDAKAEVQSVEWRNDGHVIAVLSSDGIIRLVNSFSGKVVHRFSSLPTYAPPLTATSPRTRRSNARNNQVSSKPKATTLSYTIHFSDPKSTQSLLQAATAEKSVVLDDLLSLNTDLKTFLKSPADLPRELINIDVESFLPRLSCLPPVGYGGEDVFSTRTSIDAIFHSSKKPIQSGTVDVLMAGDDEGTVSLRIFDSFEVGGVDLNSAAGIRKTSQIGRVVQVCGWPFTSEIFVIAEDTNNVNLHLLSLDLKFISRSSDALPVLATKATQLHNLLRYLTQIQSQLIREVKTSFDLPTRYLRNVNEDLEGQDGKGASFATAAYHAIVTGEVSGVFKDWLSDQVGERGAKRWEKSVGDCLELVKRLMSEAWCPAVERAGVVISRLSGLAGWSANSDTEGPRHGLDRALIESLSDTVAVMAISGEECLRDVIEENSLFGSFVKWLKWEVEASALEDTSEKLHEMREASDHGDVMKVLEYIEQGPQTSVVSDYLSSTSNSTATVEHGDAGFYTSFMDEREKRGSSHHRPTFDHLLNRMSRQCNKLFERIAQNHQRGTITRHIAQLATDLDKCMMRIRVVPQNGHENEFERSRVHIIARKQDDKTRAIQQIINTDSSQNKVETIAIHSLQPPDVSQIMDIQFVDNDYFMVLVNTNDEPRIYSRRIEADQGEEWELRHRFPDGFMESGMRPAHLEINGRKKRRTVGVVDESGKGFVIFDLDSGEAEPTSNGGDESMTG